jgi:hypothetical protein
MVTPAAATQAAVRGRASSGAGRRGARNVEPGLHEFTHAPIEFQLAAVTEGAYRGVVDEAIQNLVDADAWHVEQLTAQSERSVLKRIIERSAADA